MHPRQRPALRAAVVRRSELFPVRFFGPGATSGQLVSGGGEVSKGAGLVAVAAGAATFGAGVNGIKLFIAVSL